MDSSLLSLTPLPFCSCYFSPNARHLTGCVIIKAKAPLPVHIYDLLINICMLFLYNLVSTPVCVCVCRSFIRRRVCSSRRPIHWWRRRLRFSWVRRIILCCVIKPKRLRGEWRTHRTASGKCETTYQHISKISKERFVKKSWWYWIYNDWKTFCWDLHRFTRRFCLLAKDKRFFF